MLQTHSLRRTYYIILAWKYATGFHAEVYIRLNKRANIVHIGPRGMDRGMLKMYTARQHDVIIIIITYKGVQEGFSCKFQADI